jgi:hypothetical protein
MPRDDIGEIGDPLGAIGNAAALLLGDADAGVQRVGRALQA